MRYFISAWLLVVILAVGMLGSRGGFSRKPPIEVFPDMDRQAKLRPQVPNSFFADGRSSRLPVAGTIARGTPLALSATDSKKQVYPYEDAPAITGFVKGSTNFVELNPFEITAQFIARGQERFNISCFPCHGPLADGNGVTKKLGMAVVANLHDGRILKMSDGEIFNVISNGRNLMGGYAANIDVQDRWAIIAYLRALQLSRLGNLNDVPEQMRASLKK